MTIKDEQIIKKYNSMPELKSGKKMDWERVALGISDILSIILGVTIFMILLEHFVFNEQQNISSLLIFCVVLIGIKFGLLCRYYFFREFFGKQNSQSKQQMVKSVE